MAASQAVPRPATKALLPALLVGYVLPSILMVALDAKSPLIQETIVFWQIGPILIVGLTELFTRPSAAPRKSAAPPEKYTQPTAFSGPAPQQHQPLRLVYTTTFALSAAIHVATLAYLAFNPALSLVRTFVPSVADVQTSRVQTVAHGMGIFFKFDLLLSVAAAFVWSVATIWDLRRVGLAEQGVLRSVLGLCVGYVVVGPGAATAALWRKREEVVLGFKPRTRRRV